MGDDTHAEIWRAIEGHPYYDVSNQGRVRSRIRGGLPRVLAPCSVHGYMQVKLRHEGRATHHYVHRLVLAAFVGPLPSGMQVAHNNNNRGDNRLGNLRYATLVENQADRIGHGTHMPGEDHPQHVLTEDEVRELRDRYARGGITHAELALIYGVSKGNIGAIIRRERWKHVA